MSRLIEKAFAKPICVDNLCSEVVCAEKGCIGTELSRPIEIPIADLVQIILQRKDAKSAKRKAKRARPSIKTQAKRAAKYKDDLIIAEAEVHIDAEAGTGADDFTGSEAGIEADELNSRIMTAKNGFAVVIGRPLLG